MRPGTVLGALLVFAGVIALSVGGFSFTMPVPLPTTLGGLAVAAGIVLIIASSRKAR
jgi:drug/metabolite transporter (DMT)-like permease